MEIIVEVGTPAQQAAIRQELGLVSRLVDRLGDQVNLLRLIVPLDYDATVNEIQGTTTFVAYRGVGERKVTGVAKMIPVENGNIIVISPLLYIEPFDAVWRLFVLVHELLHVASHTASPEDNTPHDARSSYRGSLRRLYDEYWADRGAYSVVDSVYPDKSEFWLHHVQSAATDLRELFSDPVYSEIIRGHIESFRERQFDVDQFVAHIKPTIDEVAMSTVHGLALLHHYPDGPGLDDFGESSFLNSATKALAEYFRQKYDKNDRDLSDGVEIMADYMANFGVRYEDTSEGMYCHVRDI